MDIEFNKYCKADKKRCGLFGKHYFTIIRDKEIKEKIRLEYPKMTSAIWCCIYCECIVEST